MSEVKNAVASFINMYSKSGMQSGTYERTPESDRETLINHISFAEQVFPGSCIMLCPRSHLTFHYISRNCENVIGHKHHEMLKLDVPDLFSHIHPDDLAHVRQCFEFIAGCSPLDPSTHRFIMFYRFRNASGEYLHIRNEHVAIRTQSGNYVFLMLFKDLSDSEKFHQVKLDVYRYMRGNMTKVYDYKPRQAKNEMTPRQHDIARLTSKGYSNQEIADQLNVSIFTVKNHKRILFKKINVKNSIELAGSNLIT